MEQSKFIKLMTMLKIAYPYYFKEMTKEESVAFLQLYSSYLKEYDYTVALKAIQKIIIDSNFMPTISEVVKECDRQQRIYYKNKIDLMYKEKYFTDEEYGKCLTWLFEERPLIPGWLKEEVLNYSETKQIENN